MIRRTLCFLKCLIFIIKASKKSTPSYLFFKVKHSNAFVILHSNAITLVSNITITFPITLVYYLTEQANKLQKLRIFSYNSFKMSGAFYEQVWRDAQQKLEDLTVTDFENQAQDVHVNRRTSQAMVFELYLKYINVANKLEEVYDKIVQPQKRLLVRKILDSTLSRIIELKHDLVNLDLMEFSYNDKVMEKLKITPMETELRIPKYFLRENASYIKGRKTIIDNILIKLGWLDEDQEQETLSELDSIKIIQMHERARQGRLR